MLLHMHGGMRTGQARAEGGAEQDAPHLARALARGVQRRRQAARARRAALQMPSYPGAGRMMRCRMQRCQEAACMPRGPSRSAHVQHTPDKGLVQYAPS